MNNRYCTVPAWFGFDKWFERIFHYACKVHDQEYVEQNVTRKQSDQRLFAYMVKKGYPVLGITAYYCFLRPLGWLYWNDIIGGKNTKVKL